MDSDRYSKTVEHRNDGKSSKHPTYPDLKNDEGKEGMIDSTKAGIYRGGTSDFSNSVSFNIDDLDPIDPNDFNVICNSFQPNNFHKVPNIYVYSVYKTVNNIHP